MEKISRKKVSLGLEVQKKRSSNYKPTKKKKVVNKVLDYLKSDSYLFAPLIYSAFPSPNSASATVELKEPFKRKKKRFLKKVEEYLKSDSHMYASLVGPPQSFRDHPNGSLQCKSTITEMSMRSSTFNDDRLANEIAQGQASKDCSPMEMISDRHSNLVHRETIKHMIYQNCRFLSTGHILKLAHDLPELSIFINREKDAQLAALEALLT